MYLYIYTCVYIYIYIYMYITSLVKAAEPIIVIELV